MRRARGGSRTAWGAIAMMLTVSCSGGEAAEPASARGVVERAIETTPSLPVVVPEELPGPYELDEALGSQLDADGQAFGSEWHYRQSEASRSNGELPVVSICTVRNGHPWTCMPKRDALFIRRLPGISAAVYAIGPGPDGAAAAHWDGTELTTNWKDVSWLQK